MYLHIIVDYTTCHSCRIGFVQKSKDRSFFFKKTFSSFSRTCSSNIEKIIETFKVAIGIGLIIFFIYEVYYYNYCNLRKPKTSVNDETHESNSEEVGSQPVTIHWLDRILLHFCNCCNMCKSKPRVNAEIHEPNLEEVVVDQDSELDGPAPWPILEAVDPMVVDQEAVVQSSQPAIIQNTENLHDKNQEINDLPTFDEALKMEIVKMDKSQSKARRRLSSRLSKTNDELPDYETHESNF